MASRRDLIDAIQKGELPLFEKALAENPALAGERDDQGVSLLILSLYYRQSEMALGLLARRQELDVFEAACLGRTERVKELLAERPEGLEERSPDGFTPLHYAAFFAHEELAAFLLERGAAVNSVAENPMRVQPLHSAVAAGNLPVVRRLLAAGADPNGRQQVGFTPLMGAAAGGHREILELLLAHGADKAAVADNGKTARDLALDRGHGELAELL
ncbi:MAG TPA: ankyrin repeat domain-containing protein [Thermoanaerobaculia bacterium]|nr:ankyrin repeat domain-containing protein [Thermoanaerobaculia bacterium]